MERTYDETSKSKVSPTHSQTSMLIPSFPSIFNPCKGLSTENLPPIDQVLLTEINDEKLSLEDIFSKIKTLIPLDIPVLVSLLFKLTSKPQITIFAYLIKENPLNLNLSALQKILTYLPQKDWTRLAHYTQNLSPLQQAKTLYLFEINYCEILRLKLNNHTVSAKYEMNHLSSMLTQELIEHLETQSGWYWPYLLFPLGDLMDRHILVKQFTLAQNLCSSDFKKLNYLTLPYVKKYLSHDLRRAQRQRILLKIITLAMTSESDTDLNPCIKNLLTFFIDEVKLLQHDASYILETDHKLIYFQFIIAEQQIDQYSPAAIVNLLSAIERMPSKVYRLLTLGYPHALNPVKELNNRAHGHLIAYQIKGLLSAAPFCLIQHLTHQINLESPQEQIYFNLSLAELSTQQQLILTRTILKYGDIESPWFLQFYSCQIPTHIRISALMTLTEIEISSLMTVQPRLIISQILPPIDTQNKNWAQVHIPDSLLNILSPPLLDKKSSSPSKFSNSFTHFMPQSPLMPTSFNELGETIFQSFSKLPTDCESLKTALTAAESTREMRIILLQELAWARDYEPTALVAKAFNDLQKFDQTVPFSLSVTL